MRKLLVVLIVLAALAVGGDRLVARLVADEAQQRLVAEGFRDPTVRMHGFPFLTQLAARTFEQVTVTGAGLQAGKGRATGVRAELTDVRAPQSGPVQIGSLVASGTVPFDVMVEAVGVPSLELSSGQGGQVEVARTVEVAGRSFDVVAQARVEARGTQLRIVPTEVAVTGSSLDGRLSALLSERVALTYDIPDLPDGVQIERITAAQDGFLVRVKGRAVSVEAG